MGTYASVIGGFVHEIWTTPAPAAGQAAVTPAVAFPPGAGIGQAGSFVACDPSVQPGWVTTDGGKTFAAPIAPVGPPLASLQASLCADIDAQAEAQRLLYVTGGATQAIVYLQMQTQAAGALTGLQASPAMTAQQGAAAYGLLASEIGITVDPTTNAPSVDVFGVARAVAATVAVWLPMASAINRSRKFTKAAISAATTAAAAQAAHDGVAWPVPPMS